MSPTMTCSTLLMVFSSTTTGERTTKAWKASCIVQDLEQQMCTWAWIRLGLNAATTSPIQSMFRYARRTICRSLFSAQAIHSRWRHTRSIPKAPGTSIIVIGLQSPKILEDRWQTPQEVATCGPFPGSLQQIHQHNCQILEAIVVHASDQ